MSAKEKIATVILTRDNVTEVNLKLPTLDFYHLYKLLIISGSVPCYRLEKRKERTADFKLNNTVLK